MHLKDFVFCFYEATSFSNNEIVEFFLLENKNIWFEFSII